jgi:hypothetical protein
MYWQLPLAIILGALEILAERANSRTRRYISAKHPRWAVVHRWRWALGVVLGIASVFVFYPLTGGDGVYRIFGFPFMTVAFDAAGSDYVGPLTPAALLANGGLWFFLPSLFLWCWGWAIRPKASATSARV